MAALPQPLLTVIVSPREGYFAAVSSLQNVLADGDVPFELIYLDIQAPVATSAALQALCGERGGRFIRHDDWIAPSAARKAAARLATTPYVAFIDNDVFIQPGTMAALVACAEATGAGIVGPLYVQHKDGETQIHMAGGQLQRDAAGGLVAEHHRLIHLPPDAALGESRREVDFVEYHLALFRTELAQDPEVISDDVLLAHEHIDVALAVKAKGFQVWMEPAARADLMVLVPPRLGDLAFYLRRWDRAGCEADLAAFARRWPVAEASGFANHLRQFHTERLAARALRDQMPAPGADQAMSAAELAQTRTALREQALARGYGAGDVRNLELALDFATLICDGLYRADGRPFLMHLIGTASALIRYDLRFDVVLAGLLHSAYAHRPPWFAEAEVTRMLASGGEVDAIVRALPWAKPYLQAGGDAQWLMLTGAWALTVEAANQVDLLLSGEYRATAKPPEVSEAGHALLADVLDQLGAPGLAKSARGSAGAGAQTQILGRGPPFDSFRLDARNRQLLSSHAPAPDPSLETRQ